MTQFSPAPRRSLWRAVCDRNPFYLLSVACMLFGSTSLANSSSWSPIKLNRLLILVATLNIYEFLLIALAHFLIVRRGLRRDGTMLLVIEAFFLVDATFLNSEIFSTDLRIGLPVNVVLFMLAIVKIAVIFRTLGIALTRGAFFTAAIELFMLFALPGMFKWISLGHNGSVPALVVYGAWWVIGLLPMIAALLMRNRHLLPEPMRGALQRSLGIVALLVILPVVSLLAHVCTSNWIYNVRWYPANVSPLVLGLAVAIGACDVRVRTFGLRTRAHLVFPLVALAMSASFPSSLVFHAQLIWFSPLRCTLIGAMLAYLSGYLLHRHILFAWAACLCLGAAGVGMSVRQILENMDLGARRSLDCGERLWPRSMMEWGAVSMAASFVWLILGALVSLRKPVQAEVIENRN